MRSIPFLALFALAGPAAAETIVSAAPEAVSVTVYREPGRSAGGTLELGNLTGFAVISERRMVTLPAGDHVLRFEGVANGMLAASAVIEGLPGGVEEKNRDAKLLTPRSLVESAIGGEATLVRTDPATGRERALPVRILSGPEGVLLQSAEGIEALRCSALPERLVFAEAPAGLSDTPTLSVRTRSAEPVSAVVTLSYLAQGFDWAANYVAHLAPESETLTLTGWVTLANANANTFPDAPTQIVAGTVNRSDDTSFFPTVRDPQFQDYANCWPWDTTATAASRWAPQNYAPLPAPPPPPVAMMARAAMAEDSIVATGAKLQQEELGDLKLYRTPEPTTIASSGQKQVLLLSEPDIPYRRVYRADIINAGPDPTAAQILLRLSNERNGPLAQALPAGRMAVFEQALGRPMLLGEDDVRDAAVGEELEIELGSSPDVRFSLDETQPRRTLLRLSNARSEPVMVEARLPVELLAKAKRRPLRRGGYAMWSITVPANGEATLEFHQRTQ